jgi:N,N'-diacetyllegionaminate synthase
MKTTKTYVIAEIAQGFEGDYNLCRRFVKLAKDVNANAVKFQIFKARELCTADYKYNELFNSLEISEENWTKVINYANELGIDFLADIYGIETFEWISKKAIAGIKIHSTDLRNYRLLNVLQNKNMKIFLSAGGSTEDELERAIGLLGRNQISLMPGFQAEPNVYQDVELDKIQHLSNKFGLPVGYADHIDANDPLATILPAMAVLKGATIIEKHLTVDRNYVMLEDYVSALNPGEFVKMVDLIASVEQFTYTGSTFELSEREKIYRKNTKKAVLATRPIKSGQKFSSEDVTMLRTGKTVDELIDIEEIIGKTAKHDLEKEAVITRSDFQ